MSETVLSRNVFSMLDEDGPAPAKAKKEAPKAAEAAPAKKEPSRKSEDRRRDGGARGGRGGRGGGRGGGGDRGDRPPSGRDRQPREKREFDRHESGTGRDRSAKREGAGKYNWGKDGEGAEGGEDRPRRERRERRPRRDAEGEGGGDKAEKAEGESKEDREEEDEKVISYEEYLAQKEASRVEADLTKKVRTVEIDNSLFKSCGTKAVEKEEGVDTYAYPEDQRKGGPKKHNKKAAAKKVISLDEFASAKPAKKGGGLKAAVDARGGARGGRGGARGGRGGRGFKVNADEFPTLGGK